MSYLLDKKNKRRKFAYLAFFVAVVLILFYLRSGIWHSLSFGSQTVFRPILVASGNIGERFAHVGSYFNTKKSLYRENEDLRFRLMDIETRMTNYDTLLAENDSLKEILNRKEDGSVMVVAGILSKPNRNLYESLTIDAGTNQGVNIGDLVFAFGNVPIGRVSAVYPYSARVTLFSASGERTQVVAGDRNIFLEIEGRGGGSFEMIMPRDLATAKGDAVTLPGISPRIAGIVEAVISDPREPFIKALLVAPVNAQELKFVQVEIQR